MPPKTWRSRRPSRPRTRPRSRAPLMSPATTSCCRPPSRWPGKVAAVPLSSASASSSRRSAGSAARNAKSVAGRARTSSDSTRSIEVSSGSVAASGGPSPSISRRGWKREVTSRTPSSPSNERPTCGFTAASLASNASWSGAGAAACLGKSTRRSAARVASLAASRNRQPASPVDDQRGGHAVDGERRLRPCHGDERSILAPVDQRPGALRSLLVELDREQLAVARPQRGMAVAVTVDGDEATQPAPGAGVAGTRQRDQRRLVERVRRAGCRRAASSRSRQPPA